MHAPPPWKAFASATNRKLHPEAPPEAAAQLVDYAQWRLNLNRDDLWKKYQVRAREGPGLRRPNVRARAARARDNFRCLFPSPSSPF